MDTISIPVAFWAGLVSFFSPCILPLIPAYIVYISGSMSEEEVYKNKKIAVIRTFGFVIGFSIIFILLGAAATAVGSFISKNLIIFRRISGIFIILFGLYMLNIIDLKFLNKSLKIKAPKIKGFFSSLLMGMAFSIGWTPCVGAVLGTILFFATTQNTVYQGILMLTAYSAGLAIPFIIVSFLLEKFNKNIRKIEKVSVYISKIGGIIIVLLGILVIIDKLTIILNIIS